MFLNFKFLEVVLIFFTIVIASFDEEVVELPYLLSYVILLFAPRV